MYRTPITDTDLQAYVDGQLGAARRKEVEQYLADHPEAAAQVEEYRRINEGLHALFDPVLDEPVPAQLSVSRSRRHVLLRVAAVAAWMMLGGIIGWQIHPTKNSINLVEAPVQQNLVQTAAFAHSIYTVEVRHPVEVTAEHEQHLVAWLSKRMHTPIHVPDLNQSGYALVGGRLLPSSNQLAAQFMYERNDGMRVTLYTRHGDWGNEATSFRYAREDNVGVFYWIEGSLGYALVGNLSRDELLTISERVYQQLHE